MVSGREARRRATPGGERRVIVGPILSDLLALKWGGEQTVLATAFYSKRALQSLTVSSNRLQVLCRLDRDDPEEWARGMIAPDALLERLRSFEENGTRIDLRVHRAAHAKVYWGECGVIIGSANLTLQGFGGAWEMVHASSTPEDIRKAKAGLKVYARTLDALTLDDLEAYVAQHGSFVRDYAKEHRNKSHRDRVSAPNARPPRLGGYADFLKWVNRHTSAAAGEIYARANGKGNLSGHINRNFFGLRQFLLAYPEHLARFRKKDPDTYKLSQDAMTERDMAIFVKNYAADEDTFALNTWKTYLPQECGGRAGKHGGTIGNLNRMLPLVALYLAKRTAQ